MTTYGIVEWFGGNDSAYPCGYCKGIKSGTTDHGKFRTGMWAHRLSNNNYQTLIDRNWRRSGKYCYKPVLNQTCCPMYTIRCDALNFRLRKSHKKVIKKFNRFIISGEKSSKRSESEVQVMDVISDHNSEVVPLMDESNAKQEYKLNVNSNLKSFDVMSCDSNPTPSEDKPKPIVQKKTKAKSLRIERKLNKIMKREKCDKNKAFVIMKEEFNDRVLKQNKSKTIEEYLNEFETKSEVKHKLKIRFVSTTTDDYKKTFEASHEVYRRYQMFIHNDSIDKCTAKQYKRFLIDSPIESQHFESSDELPDHFGSYHQQYWLDDKLIAVGVIDILPLCVSSVYLYYDPEYDFLSLGTYSALREISFVRKLQQFIPQLKYYYMGFYIHTCPKMKYKGKFMPSELLCAETYSWHSIEKCVTKLNALKYCRFSDNANEIDLNSNQINDNEIKILFNSTVMSFSALKSIRAVDNKEEEDIKHYAKLVGRKGCKEILLFRS